MIINLGFLKSKSLLKEKIGEDKIMTKFVKFQVSEDRFTKLKQLGFENIDHYLNTLIDRDEQSEQNHGSSK